MKKFLSTLALSLPLLASAQNLVANGSFESALAGTWNLTGFGLYPPTIIPYGPPGSAFGEVVPADTLLTGSPDAVGLAALYFVDDASAQIVSQSFKLIAGVQYDVGFDYYATQNGSLNNNNAILSTFVSAVSNAQAVFSSVVNLAAAPVTTWTGIRSSFTPSTSGDYTFAFSFASTGFPAKDIVVDRAFVTAVPEPETYGLMVLGLVAVAGAVRRRTSQR